MQALARGGFRQGASVILLERFAAGNMATSRAQVEELLEGGVDMLVAIGTPPLTAILAIAPARVPVVFWYCSNPWGAGAGTSYTRHRPNVVGMVSTSPLAEQLDLARRITPSLASVGLILNPSEANASFEAELLRREATVRSITVVIEPVSGPGEVARAADALASRRVGALVRVGDYATSVGFPALAAAGLRHRLPVYSVDPSDITTPGPGGGGLGPASRWGPGRRSGGAGAARPFPRRSALRTGDPEAAAAESPTARAIGVTLPPQLLRQADHLEG